MATLRMQNTVIFLSSNLRTIISLLLTVVTCILALRGNEQAVASLIGAFGVLAGALWGERAALKVPGEKNDTH